jgi:hypothetical protein
LSTPWLNSVAASATSAATLARSGPTAAIGVRSCEPETAPWAARFIASDKWSLDRKRVVLGDDLMAWSLEANLRAEVVERATACVTAVRFFSSGKVRRRRPNAINAQSTCGGRTPPDRG